jgi:hypothetical protein
MVETIAFNACFWSPDSNAIINTFSSLTRYGLKLTLSPVDGTDISYIGDEFNFGNAISFLLII